MFFSTLFIGINLATVVATIAILVVFFRAKPQRFGKFLVIASLAAVVILFVLHWVSMRNEALPKFWWWLFDFDDDRNLPGIFSALIWLFIGLILFRIAFKADHSIAQRAYWLGMALIFLFFGVDDYFAIHETMIPSWRTVYAIGAMAFVGVNVLAYWRWLRHDFRQHRAIGVILVVSLFLFGISGLLIEEVFFEMCIEDSTQALCQNRWRADSLEEMNENLAAIAIMGGLLLFAQTRLSQAGGAQLRRWIFAGGVVVPIALCVYLWLLPVLEANLIATPVAVNYGNDELSLIGFTPSRPVMTTDKRLRLNLYWKTGTQANEDYRLSMHLVSHPDVESVGQADRVHIGQIPSRAWLPGMIVRKTVHIDLPDDLHVPASYWLILRVWSGSPERNWLDTDSLLVRDSDRPLLTEDTVILTSVAALPVGDSPSLTVQSDFRYAEGLSLVGYSVPDQLQVGGPAQLQFHWRTATMIDTGLTQFVHLLAAENKEFRWGYDQEPFNGTFPTSDWPGDLDAVDSWMFTLPDDLEPGRYLLVTGLYDSMTVERAAVVDADGQPLPNQLIELGSIDVLPPPAS